MSWDDPDLIAQVADLLRANKPDEAFDLVEDMTEDDASRFMLHLTETAIEAVRRRMLH